MVVKKILSLYFLLILAACSVPNWYKPSGHRLFKQLPKGGTPGFELGWIHGCQSGIGSQFGGALMMNFYTWSKDPDIASSNPDIDVIRARYKKEFKDINWDDLKEVSKNFRDYNTIFWSSHIFCRHSILVTMRSAGMTPPLPGETRYDPGVHSLGSVWKINGYGDTRFHTGGNW